MLQTPYSNLSISPTVLTTSQGLTTSSIGKAVTEQILSNVAADSRTKWQDALNKDIW